MLPFKRHWSWSGIELYIISTTSFFFSSVYLVVVWPIVRGTVVQFSVDNVCKFSVLADENTVSGT